MRPFVIPAKAVSYFLHSAKVLRFFRDLFPAAAICCECVLELL